MNMDDMKRHMRAYAEKLHGIEVETAPNMLAAVMLAAALKRNGIPEKTAEALALRAEVKVGEKLMTDDAAFVEEVVSGVAVGIARLYRAIGKLFPLVDPDEEIMHMSHKFSLELDF